MLSAAWHVFVELAPWLLVGTVFAGVLHVVLPTGWIRRRLRGPRGVLKAVALGVPMPLCSCGVIPAGIGLKRDGADDGAAIGFLISTPQTGIDSILVSGSFLGWPFALFKMASAAVTGLVGGLLTTTGRGTRPSELPALNVLDAPPDSATRRTWRDGVEQGVEVVRSIWPWVLAGVVVSAAIDFYVPKSWLQEVGAWGTLPAALGALVLSLPLYVCATASVPIAASLVAAGLPAGSALVFLIAGPATNVGTIGAISKHFGWRTTAVYLGTIIVGSIGSAYLFDGLLPTTVSATPHAHHGEPAWWGVGSAVLLAGSFAWFAVDDVRSWLRRRSTERSVAGDPDSLRVSVEGMNCGNCVNRLEKALRETRGVASVVVHLEPGEAIVHGPVPEDEVRRVVRDSGFRDVRVDDVH